MNPAVAELLSTLFRYVILIAFSKLTAWGILTDDQGNRLVSQFTEMFIQWVPIGGVMLWGLWKTLKKRTALNVARTAPQGTSEATVNAKVAKMPVSTKVATAFASPVQ